MKNTNFIFLKMLILEHQDFQKALRSPGDCSFLYVVMFGDSGKDV